MPILRSAWHDTTKCANWLLTQYYSGDTLYVGDKPSMWKAPYLYPRGRQIFPKIEPQTLVSIINTVQAKYRAIRFDLWRHKTSLPTFRDLPLPLNRQSWKLACESERRLFLFRFSGNWHELILRGGAQFHRQHQALNAILSGNAEAGEAALYQNGKSLMLKIAGWFPKVEIRGANGSVKASTAIDAFLIAVAGGSVWRLNADHVYSWVVAADKQQQRLREDLKAERRFPKSMREGIVSRMGKLSELRSNRIDSWMHEASIQLVNWTKRQHSAELVWDDSCPSMVPSFPWFDFAQRIEDKCRMAGISFTRASDGVVRESGRPFAKAVKG